MIIFIKNQQGKSFTVEVDSERTVGELKDILQEMERIPSNLQKLIFGGRQLQNDRRIGYSGISKECTLYLIIKTPYEKFKIFDFPESENLESCESEFGSCIEALKRGSENLHENIVANDVFSKITNSRENGPLFVIISFLSLFHHITTIPLVSKSFKHTSECCMEEKQVQFFGSQFKFLFENCEHSTVMCEPLLNKLLNYYPDVARYHPYKLLKYIKKNKYHNAAEKAIILSKVQLKTLLPFTLQDTFNHYLQIKNLKIARIFIDHFEGLEISGFQIINLIEDMKLMDLKDFISKYNEKHELNIRYLFRHYLSNPDFFGSLLERFFPPDEYQTYIDRSSSISIEDNSIPSDLFVGIRKYGFQYRMERIEYLLSTLMMSEKLSVTEDVESIRYLCQKKFDIHPTEEQKKVIDHCFPRFEFPYLRQMDEQYCDFIVRHRQSGNEVFSIDESNEKRKSASLELLRKFWFSTRDTLLMKQLIDFLAFEKENSWMNICHYRFEIERFLLFDSEEEIENPEIIFEKMLDNYNQNFRESDPNPNMLFHSLTVLKVCSSRKLYELLLKKNCRDWLPPNCQPVFPEEEKEGEKDSSLVSPFGFPGVATSDFIPGGNDGRYLKVKRGEEIRIMEYRNKVALVQRKSDGDQGLVPMSCIQEKLL